MWGFLKIHVLNSIWTGSSRDFINRGFLVKSPSMIACVKLFYLRLGSLLFWLRVLSFPSGALSTLALNAVPEPPPGTTPTLSDLLRCLLLRVTGTYTDWYLVPVPPLPSLIMIIHKSSFTFLGSFDNWDDFETSEVISKVFCLISTQYTESFFATNASVFVHLLWLHVCKTFLV